MSSEATATTTTTTSTRSASDEKRRVQNREAQRNRRRNVRQQLAHYEQLLQTMGLASRADSNIRDRHHSNWRTSTSIQDANPPSPSSPLGNQSATDSASSPPGSAHGSLQYQSQQSSPQYAPQPLPPETSFYWVDTGLILSSLYEHEREPIGDLFGGGSSQPHPMGIDTDYGYSRPDLTMGPGATHEYYSTSPAASESRGRVEMTYAFVPNPAGAPMDRSDSYQQQWPAGGSLAPASNQASSSRMSNASHSPHIKTGDDLAPNTSDMKDIQMSQAPHDLHSAHPDHLGRGFQAGSSAPFAASQPPSINPQQLQLPPSQGMHQTQLPPQQRRDSQSPLGRSTSWTPLHHATNSRNIGMMVLLIQNGAEVSARDDEGNTALHLAARTGDAESMATLLRHHGSSSSNASSSQQPTEASSDGSPPGEGEAQAATPATTASSSSPPPALSQQQQKQDVKQWIDLENSGGLTPLHLAVTSGHAHIVKMLIEAGADVNSRMPAL